MIHHLCGKPEIDDGFPDIFYWDESCVECRKMRDAIIIKQLKDMKQDHTYEHVMRNLDHEIVVSNSFCKTEKQEPVT